MKKKRSSGTLIAMTILYVTVIYFVAWFLIGMSL